MHYLQYLKCRFLYLLLLCSCIGDAQSQGGKLVFQIKLEGEKSEKLQKFMPTSYEYYFNQKDMLIRFVGGSTSSLIGDLLYKGADKSSYMIKHQEKNIFKGKYGNKENPKLNTELTITNEYQQILGYRCRKYLIYSADGSQKPVDQEVWATDELKFNIPETLGNSLYFRGVKGIPLKVVEKMENGITMTMLASQVDTNTQPPTFFTLPVGYKLKEIASDNE